MPVGVPHDPPVSVLLPPMRINIGPAPYARRLATYCAKIASTPPADACPNTVCALHHSIESPRKSAATGTPGRVPPATGVEPQPAKNADKTSEVAMARLRG